MQAPNTFPVKVKILQVQMNELKKYIKEVDEQVLVTPSDVMQAIEENFQAISLLADKTMKEIQSSFVIKMNPKIAKLQGEIEDTVKKANGSHPGLVRILEFEQGQLKALVKEVNKNTTDIESIAVLNRRQERVQDINLIYEETAKLISNSTSTNY